MSCVYCSNKGYVYSHYITKDLDLKRGIVCKDCYASIGGVILTYELTQAAIDKVEQKLKGCYE